MVMAHSCGHRSRAPTGMVPLVNLSQRIDVPRSAMRRHRAFLSGRCLRGGVTTLAPSAPAHAGPHQEIVQARPRRGFVGPRRDLARGCGAGGDVRTQAATPATSPKPPPRAPTVREGLRPGGAHAGMVASTNVVRIYAFTKRRSIAVRRCLPIRHRRFRCRMSSPSTTPVAARGAAANDHSRSRTGRESRAWVSSAR